MKRIYLLIATVLLVAGCKKSTPEHLASIVAFTPTEARHGESVTITGEGFSLVREANTVTFNGVPAIVTGASSTLLVVEVPKNMQCSGELRVTVDGTTVTAYHRFAYLPTGMVTTIAGEPGWWDYADGQGRAARFSRPAGMTFDAAGNLLVADVNNCRIRRVTPAGAVTTVAGAGYGYDNGNALTEATFRYPIDVAVDAGGNIYVADAYNSLVRKVTPAGVVSTLAEGFANVTGVAVDAAGNVL